ncbi:hypothetical protein GI582_11180 [Sulfitobacter sp. BDSS02]|nr:hypothetical protein [Sulfitobacter sp. BDSS02]MBR9850046.1 hypothetical protein [Paracoccaceae bacterium]
MLDENVTLGCPIQLAHILAKQVAVDDFSGITRLAESYGVPPPFLSWNVDPRSADLRVERNFWEITQGFAQADGSVRRDLLTMDRYGSMNEWLMLLDKNDGTPGYRYSQFGPAVETWCVPATSAEQNTLDFDGFLGIFLTATYEAIAMRNKPLLSIHQSFEQAFVSKNRRIIIPLVDRQGENDGFIALNTPTNLLQPGLEVLPVPVLVVDGDMTVCFANKEARKSLDSGRYGPWDRSLFQYAGIDLTIESSPEEILISGVPHASTCRHLAHHRIGTFKATVTAARHFEHVFYIIMLTRD